MDDQHLKIISLLFFQVNPTESGYGTAGKTDVPYVPEMYEIRNVGLVVIRGSWYDSNAFSLLNVHMYLVVISVSVIGLKMITAFPI
jgi:hypothetical protein